jgi:copper transport protein
MRRAAAATAVVALALLYPAAAAAHPRAVATIPAAGAVVPAATHSVSVRLSEPAEPVGDGISVRGPDGHEAARGPVVVRGATISRRIDSKLHGSYVVEWQVVGDDAHPARGVFIFSVGSPTLSEAPSAGHTGVVLQTLGRFLSFAGYALGFGVPFAALLSGGMTPRLWRLVSTGIVLMLVAEPVALVGQTATLAPSRALDAGLARDVLQTSYGHVTALRLGAAIGLWALAGAVRSSSARAQWSIPALGLAVAVVQADAGHRIAGVPTAVAILLGAAHIASFGAWLGCVAVAVGERRGRELARPAVLSALLLVSTGAALAFGQLGSVGDLVHTAYGRTLGLKLALAAAALALGAAARRRAELAAALAVLAAAGLLVSLTPP